MSNISIVRDSIRIIKPKYYAAIQKAVTGPDPLEALDRIEENLIEVYHTLYKQSNTKPIKKEVRLFYTELTNYICMARDREKEKRPALLPEVLEIVKGVEK